jgi:hypothetical protein
MVDRLAALLEPQERLDKREEPLDRLAILVGKLFPDVVNRLVPADCRLASEAIAEPTRRLSFLEPRGPIW